jgi:two-component system, sensor histidine kinase LadS
VGHKVTRVLFQSILTLIFLVLCLNQSLTSQTVESFGNERSPINITPFATINPNASNEQDLFKILKSNPNDWISIVTKKHIIYEKIGTHLWLNVKIKNSGEENTTFFLLMNEFSIEKIHCYIIKKNENIETFYSGSNLPLIQKPLYMIGSIFPIEIKQGEEVSIYIDIKSNILAVTQLELYNLNSLLDYFLKNYFIYGLYYGILFFTSIFSIAIFISLKDKSYLFYFGVILFDGLVQFTNNSLSIYFLYPDNPSINMFVWYFSYVISLSFATLFTRDFLNLPTYNVKFSKLLTSMSYFLILFIPLPYLINQNLIYLSFIVGFLYIFGLYIASYFVYSKGFTPAKYFILAWTFLILGKVISVLPFEDYNITEYSAAIGSSLEMILVTIAILSKMNTLQIEKDLMSDEITGIKKELNLAQKIQLSLLPEQLPKIKDCDIAAYYLPMKEIGGDYYDFYVKDNQSFTCIVADVSGHGPAAALIASMMKVAFNSTVNYYYRPETALRKMNQSLVGNLGKKFVTAIYAHINLRTHQLTYCSAGHPAILIHKRNENKIQHLECKGQFLGWFENIKLKEHHYRIDPGDRIIIYTDGIIEAFNEKHEMFDYTNLEIAILENGTMNADGLNHFLAYRVKEWVGFKNYFEDDITIVVIDIPF